MKVSITFFGIFLITALCSSCSATSSMDKAVITEIDSTPCFGIPENWQTRNGIPFDTLLVSEKNSADYTTHPTLLWHFEVHPPGKSIMLHPNYCIRYGEVPPSATQRTFKPLEVFKVYVVAMHAVPKDSDLRGYRAEFCIAPASNERPSVIVIPWDKSTRRWRYEICKRP